MYFSKLLLSGVLVSLVSFGMLARAETSTVKEPSPTGTETRTAAPLTFDALVQMLRGLGYEVTVKTNDNGSKTCHVKFKQDSWTYNFTLELSGDQSVIWVGAYLKPIPPGDKILPEALLKLLQLNTAMGKASFMVRDGYLYLYLPIDNNDVTPGRLRLAIDNLAGTIKQTAAAWNTGAWTAEGKDATAIKSKIDGLYRTLLDSAAEFSRALNPIFNGGAVDREQLKKAHAKVLQTLREIRQAMKGIRAPEGSPARDLVDAYEKLFEAYESIFKTELAEVVRIIEDDSIDAPARLAKVRTILEGLAKKDEAISKNLAQVLDKFRKQYGAA